MRGLLVLLCGIAFFIYAVSGPADSGSPRASLADLPAPQTTQPSTSKLPIQGPQTARVSSIHSAGQSGVTKADAPPSETKRTAEVLTAAAIAALIVAESRRAYYAGGRPCACPDDRMRNGRSCGGRSAYRRPGGASPLCYPADVTAEMIKSYRARVAQR